MSAPETPIGTYPNPFDFLLDVLQCGVAVERSADAQARSADWVGEKLREKASLFAAKLTPHLAVVEARVGAVIAAKYGLTSDSPRETEAAWAWTKGIDMAVLIAERRALFSKDDVKWTGEDAVRVVSLQYQPTGRMSLSEADFLRVAQDLDIHD